MKLPLLVSLLSISPAYGLSDSEFQARGQALKAQQRQTDALLQRLGAGAGFASAPSLAPSTQDEPRKPLFQVHGSLSDARIPVGKLLYGTLINRLVVGPEGSPIIVQLDSDQGTLAGLRLIGVARQAATEGRINFEVGKLLLRSGKAVPIQGTGLDPAGAPGLKAEVFSGKALAIAGAMASSFVSGFAASQQTQNIGALGFSAPQPTGRNALLQGVAQTAADQGKRLIEEATSEKPVLVVESQASVSVLVQEEVRF